MICVNWDLVNEFTVAIGAHCGVSIPDREAIKQELLRLLFGRKELAACYRMGLITSEEFVNAVAANLTSFVLFNAGSRGPGTVAYEAIDVLREALLGNECESSGTA